MDWLQISSIGNSKLVKSMMIWLFVTPVLAKALHPINSISFDFLMKGESLDISLPFSWEIFFLCALVFTIANIIYICKCPALIKNYKNYSDFETNDNSLFLLVSLFTDYKDKIVSNDALNYKTFAMVAVYTPDIEIQSEFSSDDTSRANWNKGVDSLKHSKESYKPDIFSALRDISSGLHPNWAFICFLLYLVGFLALGWVMYENILYVYNQL